MTRMYDKCSGNAIFSVINCIGGIGRISFTAIEFEEGGHGFSRTYNSSWVDSPDRFSIDNHTAREMNQFRTVDSYSVPYSEFL